ncbi:MAG: alpha/beta hydrolase [Sphingomonadales bacterium]|nr:alpha/beta hydrolase [Sphingomonadales bacterium]
MTDDRLALVAPELRAALDVFPKIDFSKGVEPYRYNLFGSETPPLPPELAEVRCEERMVPGHPGDPDVRVLLYTPPGSVTGLRPAVLDIHGGGFVIGNADMSDAANRALVVQLSCVVVSVDYRLAPETVWPGALNDCYAALTWLHDRADELGVDPARIAIAGGSAGGGHAAALAIFARDQSGPPICFQLLDFPMLDDRTCTASDPHPHCGDFGWTPEMNRFGWGSLLGMEPGGPNVPEAAVPARTRDLSGLPPAYILVGALDLFLEEDLDYARRLTRAGVPVELHVIPGAYHGFGLAQDAPQTKQSARLRIEALARALGVAPA